MQKTNWAVWRPFSTKRSRVWSCRSIRLVDRLLTLSRADTGDALLSAEPVDLRELADEVASQLDVLAEEKQQTLTVQHTATPHWTGDRLVLRQALLNLVDN